MLSSVDVAGYILQRRLCIHLTTAIPVLLCGLVNCLPSAVLQESPVRDDTFAMFKLLIASPASEDFSSEIPKRSMFLILSPRSWPAAS